MNNKYAGIERIQDFLERGRSNFPGSPKGLKRPCFGPILCAAGKILKNMPNKLFLGKFLPRNRVFQRSLPLKIGAEGGFRKILGSVSQTLIPQNSTKGDLLGRQGVESLVGGVPPLNPPLYRTGAGDYYIFSKSKNLTTNCLLTLGRLVIIRKLGSI